MTKQYRPLIDAAKAGDQESFNDILKPLLEKRVESILKVRKIDATQTILDAQD